MAIMLIARCPVLRRKEMAASETGDSQDGKNRAQAGFC